MTHYRTTAPDHDREGSEMTEAQLQPAGGPRRCRTVLVTGAGGFVGSRVVELLAARGDIEVIALDVVATPRGEEVSRLPGVELQVVDLRDLDTLDGDRLACAGESSTSPPSGPRPPANDRATPTTSTWAATYDLLTLATTHGVERFVFGSTNTMYGPYADPAAPPSSEAQPWVCKGINMYAATKLAAEAYLEAFANAGGPAYVARCASDPSTARG